MLSVTIVQSGLSGMAPKLTTLTHIVYYNDLSLLCFIVLISCQRELAALHIICAMCHRDLKYGTVQKS